jgi:predicted ATPase
VTFLFTDIEGSTRLWESAPDAMRVATARHDEIVRGAIEAHGGYVFATGGDGFAAAFWRAGDAVTAGVQAQAALAAEAWPDGAPIRVRMGLHTGEVVERRGDYFGIPVNQAARLMDLGHGGQVLCSAVTAGLLAPVWPVLDLGEHRLRDLSAPQRVFQIGEGRFPPLRSVDVVPSNLPTMITRLVGREAEIAELLSLVAGHRLVTVTGVGGIGKTSLALAAAAAAAPRFSDGCWFVELAPYRSGNEVPRAVATALGAAVTELGEVARYLASRELLVVLDNCEHLLDDSAALVGAVLTSAPGVRIVATSREPLGVAGETVQRVRSLGLPEPSADVDGAERAAAVQLFVERAAEATGGFVLDTASVDPVVEICRRLDGIPLALELAAARTRAMTPTDVASRLRERFRLLGGGTRGAQERHRTLLAAVSWSYDLLDDTERTVFCRLAVFPASFDLAAAEAVAAGDGTDVVDTVVRLVDRSLVQYEPDQGRYRLLETLRQYGADRLAETGDTDDTRQRHAQYFLDMVERFGPQLEDARYSNALAVLNAELDNLRAAAQWCVDGGRWGQLAAMVRRLRVFVCYSAPTDASWFGQATDHGECLDPQDFVDTLGEMAVVTATVGDFHDAVALAERSLSLAQTDGLEDSAGAWAAKGVVALFTARSHDGLRCCERALMTAEARHDEWTAIHSLAFLGMWFVEYGDPERSARCVQEALRRGELTGNPLMIEMSVLSAAGLHVWRLPGPDFAASMAVLSRYGTESRLGETEAMWFDVVWGATLAGLHQTDAVRHLARAVRLADRYGVGPAQDMALRLLAIAVAEAGYAAEAATLAGYSEAHFRAHRMGAPAYAWIQAALDDALAGLDRANNEAAEMASDRRQIMALVDHLDAAIDSPSQGPSDD